MVRLRRIARRGADAAISFGYQILAIEFSIAFVSTSFDMTTLSFRSRVDCLRLKALVPK